MKHFRAAIAVCCTIWAFGKPGDKDDTKLSEKLKTFSSLFNNTDEVVSKADIYGNEGEEEWGEDQWSLPKPSASFW